jgi:hypothetical protein
MLIIAYILFITVYVLNQIRLVVRFKTNQRLFSAKLLTEKFYSVLLILGAIIYISLIADKVIEALLNMQVYGQTSSQVPLILSTLPLVFISYNIFVYEGLFAYSDQYLIGYKFVIPLSSISITKVSVSRFNKVTAKVATSDKSVKNKEFVMRASLANYTIFKQFFDERVSEGGLEL